MQETKIHSLTTFVQHSTYWNNYPDQLGKKKKNKIWHPNLKGRTKTISTEDMTENRKDHTHMHTQRTKNKFSKVTGYKNQHTKTYYIFIHQQQTIQRGN